MTEQEHKAADNALDAVLAEIGKTFEVGFEPLEVDDKPLEILSINNMQSYLDRLLIGGRMRNPLHDLPLWAKIWPSSFILGRFLRKYSPQGKSLLEIGAGMGICGMIASRYGFAKVTVTDANDMALKFARANILRNNLQDIVHARHLDLSQPSLLPEKYDFIAASEILYLDELHRPLLKLVDKYLAPQGKAFFCTDMARLKPRFRKLAQDSFKVTEGHIGVKSNGDDGKEQTRVYNMLILERK